MAISLGTISQTIGDSTDMSRSENINKWSRRKFVRHSSRKKLTDAQMAETNFGFSVPAFTGGTIPRSQENRVWEYLKPRSGIDPSRMGDMEGYDHYAQKKYVKVIPSYSNNNIYIGESLILSMETQDDGGNLSTSVKLSELKASAPNAFNGLIDGLPIVFLFTNEGNTGTYLEPSYVVYTGQTMGDTIIRSSLKIEWAELNSGLPSGMTDGSKWRCSAFCCTNTPTFTPLKFYNYGDYDLGYLIPLIMNDDNLDASEPLFNVYRTVPLPAQGIYAVSAEFSTGDWRVQNILLNCSSYDSDSINMRFELVVKNPSWPASSQERVIGSNNDNNVYTWGRLEGSSLYYRITVGSVRMLPDYGSNYSEVYNPENGDKLYVRIYMKQAGAGTAYGQSLDVPLIVTL